MDERTLRNLEYDKIIAMLAQQAETSVGAECAGALRPSTDPDQIARWQSETDQARTLLDRAESVSLGGVRDYRESIRRAARGGALAGSELLAVAGTIAAAARVRRTLTGREDLPLLSGLAHELPVPEPVARHINRAIDDQGEVRDDASPELARLRQRALTLQSRMRSKLENLIRSPSFQHYLQEPLITIRADRYVVPVKQEYRNQVQGLVHDQSASGATLFMEPLAVVEMGNELRRAQAAEHHEVERILRQLSAVVAGVAEELTRMLNILAELDVIQARARLSLQMDACRPAPAQPGQMRVLAGRHPLLQNEAVPVDVHIGYDFDTLVITGPNTGGKTVTLKMVGLFLLMHQTGLHLPAQPGTAVGFFGGVFCDIGDEQSIEQSLSTFSSHMTQIVKILSNLKQTQGPHLVLLDELGAGTEPSEGAVLARSILEYLQEQGARTIATTHYSELKTFAYTRERVENAAVEFDLETLQPTYRLLIGLPGRSNALQIAARLGLPGNLVDRAKKLLPRRQGEVEGLLSRIADDKVQAAGERRQAEQDARDAAILRQRYEKQLADLQARERQIIENAQEEALSILQRVRRQSEDLIRELRTAHDRSELDRRAQKLKQDLEKTTSELADRVRARQPRSTEQPLTDLRPGQPVYVVSLRKAGHALDKPGGDGKVPVQVGIMRVVVPLSDLRPGAEDEITEVKDSGPRPTLVSDRVETEVHLRGMRVADALPLLDKYLDAACVAGLRQVRIVHGKGTGTLRRVVAEVLREHPRVKAFHLAPPQEGDHGVTVVELE